MKKYSIVVFIILVGVLIWREPAIEHGQVNNLLKIIDEDTKFVTAGSFLDGGSLEIELSHNHTTPLSLFFDINKNYQEVELKRDGKVHVIRLTEDDKNFILKRLRKESSPEANYMVCRLRGRVKDYIYFFLSKI